MALIMRELRAILGVILIIAGAVGIFAGVSFVCMGTLGTSDTFRTVIILFGGLFLIWLGMRLRRQ